MPSRVCMEHHGTSNHRYHPATNGFYLRAPHRSSHCCGRQTRCTTSTHRSGCWCCLWCLVQWKHWSNLFHGPIGCPMVLFVVDALSFDFQPFPSLERAAASQNNMFFILELSIEKALNAIEQWGRPVKTR